MRGCSVGVGTTSRVSMPSRLMPTGTLIGYVSSLTSGWCTWSSLLFMRIALSPRGENAMSTRCRVTMARRITLCRCATCSGRFSCAQPSASARPPSMNACCCRADTSFLGTRVSSSVGVRSSCLRPSTDRRGRHAGHRAGVPVATLQGGLADMVPVAVAAVGLACAGRAHGVVLIIV